VHDALIASGRRRVFAAAIAGVALLSVTIAAVLFPLVWACTAMIGLIGRPWSFGWESTIWAVVISMVFGLVLGTSTAWGVYRHAARDVLFDARAWPRPLPGRTVHTAGGPPPAFASFDLAGLTHAVTVMAVPYGIPAPNVAVIDDPALNSLTVGSGANAWIVVTTGLVNTLSRREVESILAFQLARVAVREVSLDTIVYACTGKTIELWGGVFDEIDETIVLLLPAAILATPFVIAAGWLRRIAVHAGARLGDGLALRAMRDPSALVAALRRIEADPTVIRNAERATAHLWLEYPHTRWSRWLMRSDRLLPARIARLSAAIPRPET